MKKSVIFGLILLPVLLSYGQQQPPVSGQQTNVNMQRQRVPVDSTIRMTHFQTEIWNPEVPVINPAAQPGDAPADAIILFGGTDINKEWEEVSRGGIRPVPFISSMPRL